MIRRIVAVLFLLPLTVVLVALALVNRHDVAISLDPFSGGDLTHAVQVPLFVLMFGLVAVGVVIGGAAAWFRQHRWRKAARRSRAELEAARAEIQDLRGRLAGPADETRRWPLRALQRPAA